MEKNQRLKIKNKKNGNSFILIFTLLSFNFVILLLVSSALGANVAITPQLLEKSIGLFPDLKGPYELRFRDDIRVHDLGFHIMKYTLIADGNEAGIVSRISSVFNEGVAGNVDVLARFDEKGRIQNIVSLKPWSEEKMGQDTDTVLSYFKGKDIREHKDTLIKLINGLAIGSNIKDVKPSSRPPKDKVWNLKGKVLEQGAKLPSLKTTDINGKAFTTEKVKGKFMVVFASPAYKPCDDMLKSMGRALDLFDTKKSLTTLYAVSAEEPVVRNYVKRLGLKGITVAEPDDHISNLFMAPFKPYVLMFENGRLKYNLVWKEEKQLFGTLFVYINGRPPTPDEVRALEVKLEAMGLKK